MGKGCRGGTLFLGSTRMGVGWIRLLDRCGVVWCGGLGQGGPLKWYGAGSVCCLTGSTLRCRGMFMQRLLANVFGETTLCQAAFCS